MALIWLALGTAMVVPIAAAAASPLLAWREPVYITAGFAGIVAMSLMLLQPWLATGALPGLARLRSRRIHIGIGMSIIGAVIIHVVGLWITSPPDVVDALLFASPTPFSAWGVIAMWGVFTVAGLAALRRRLRMRPRLWRASHMALTLVIVVGTVVHALLIDGTMEMLSKWGLCALVLVSSLFVMRKILTER